MNASVATTGTIPDVDIDGSRVYQINVANPVVKQSAVPSAVSRNLYSTGIFDAHVTIDAVELEASVASGSVGAEDTGIDVDQSSVAQVDIVTITADENAAVAPIVGGDTNCPIIGNCHVGECTIVGTRRIIIRANQTYCPVPPGVEP